jgi:hypothetical protein
LVETVWGISFLLALTPRKRAKATELIYETVSDYTARIKPDIYLPKH